MKVCVRAVPSFCRNHSQCFPRQRSASRAAGKCLFFCALLLIVSPTRRAFGQEPQAAAGARGLPRVSEQAPQPKFSHINLGLFWGRSGAAAGPAGFVEFDPIRWFGVGLFAADSWGAQNMYGGRASGWSFTGGLLFAIHPPKIKGFDISPFAQVGFNHDHGRLVIPMGVPGVYWSDGDNPERYTWTVGPSISRQLFKNGPSWSFRIGKNFGPVTAAQNGAGIYAVGGLVFPLDHPLRLAKSFVRF